MSNVNENNLKEYNYSDLEPQTENVRFIKLDRIAIDVYGQFFQGTIDGHELTFFQDRFCTFPISRHFQMYQLIEELKNYTDWTDLESNLLSFEVNNPMVNGSKIYFAFTLEETFLLIKETIAILNKMEELKDELEEQNRNQSQTKKEEADEQAEESVEQTVLV